MSERAITTCEQCGQSDSDPMVHIAGGRSVHHDCLSASERALVVGSSDTAAAVIEACEGGLRGDKLLAKINKLHAQEG